MLQEVAGERGGYLHGRGALDSDGLLYLKEQMEAEDDAERLLRRTEKRAFAAFKISFLVCFTVYAFQNLFLLIFLDHKSQSCNPSRFVSSSHSLATSQQDLLKKVVEVKPKRPKISTPSTPSLSPPIRSDRGSTDAKVNTVLKKQDRPKEQPGADPNDGKGTESKGQGNASSKGLLGLAYDSSDDED
uniref:Uncharacterized protein n=1 Tax=Brassica oleracea var. oleracea TaxID=109376 RepID=A0A0D3D0C9_BRAOL